MRRKLDPSSGKTAPLLGPGDPPPFELLNPEAEAPVLLICDHASRAVPAQLGGLGLNEETARSHIAWDIGAAEVARGLARQLGCMTLLANYSRLVIDCNRQPGDPSSIPKVSAGIKIPGNLDLDEAAEVARADAIFWPYHHVAGDCIAHLWREGTPPVLLSVHTFTRSLDGEERAWHVSALWNRDPRLAQPMIRGLRNGGGGLVVGDNQPYSGKALAYTLDLHAGAAGLANCAVEIRQDLVESPEGAERWADLLASVLAQVLATEDLHRVARF